MTWLVCNGKTWVAGKGNISYWNNFFVITIIIFAITIIITIIKIINDIKFIGTFVDLLVYWSVGWLVC